MQEAATQASLAHFVAPTSPEQPPGLAQEAFNPSLGGETPASAPPPYSDTAKPISNTSLDIPVSQVGNMTQNPSASDGVIGSDTNASLARMSTPDIPTGQLLDLDTERIKQLGAPHNPSPRLLVVVNPSRADHRGPVGTEDAVQASSSLHNTADQHSFPPASAGQVQNATGIVGMGSEQNTYAFRRVPCLQCIHVRKQPASSRFAVLPLGCCGMKSTCDFPVCTISLRHSEHHIALCAGADSRRTTESPRGAASSDTVPFSNPVEPTEGPQAGKVAQEVERIEKHAQDSESSAVPSTKPSNTPTRPPPSPPPIKDDFLGFSRPLRPFAVQAALDGRGLQASPRPEDEASDTGTSVPPTTLNDTMDRTVPMLDPLMGPMRLVADAATDPATSLLNASNSSPEAAGTTGPGTTGPVHQSQTPATAQAGERSSQVTTQASGSYTAEGGKDEERNRLPAISVAAPVSNSDAVHQTSIRTPQAQTQTAHTEAHPPVYGQSVPAGLDTLLRGFEPAGTASSSTAGVGQSTSTQMLSTSAVETPSQGADATQRIGGDAKELASGFDTNIQASSGDPAECRTLRPSNSGSGAQNMAWVDHVPVPETAEQTSAAGGTNLLTHTTDSGLLQQSMTERSHQSSAHGVSDLSSGAQNQATVQASESIKRATLSDTGSITHQSSSRCQQYGTSAHGAAGEAHATSKVFHTPDTLLKLQTSALQAFRHREVVLSGPCLLVSL